MMFGAGVSNFFALPLAIGYTRDPGFAVLTLFIGPFFVEIGWNER